ncbi:putative beta-L-arabinofuranosidase, GH127 [Rosa chinensis]|uniref:Putative beta-L-arabinofuranosidase, GH127 n=1 Tax=Rosa chinensis TaxID=74649 RepID=A0A2P6PMC7_ROSCH|nr:putative beta-L-arabinofuranosidase, GH127 [Rosa chinensis]
MSPVFVIFLVCECGYGLAEGKECTNQVFPWMASHTSRFTLLSSNNETLKNETAGLETPGAPYDAKDSWEASISELRGHFVGHYLSASAMMWASTHNDTLKEKMSGIVSSLSLCQKKIGSGYLSAFPTAEFDRFEDYKHVWAPYILYHSQGQFNWFASLE